MSSHQTGRSASSSPSESHQCGSSFVALLPFSGKSWSCGYPSVAPTAERGALYFGRRTETCRRTTGPTRYNCAWRGSGASQTGTGTNAPSSFLPQRKGIYRHHFTNMNNSLCVCVMCVFLHCVHRRAVHLWKLEMYMCMYLKAEPEAWSLHPSCPLCLMMVTGSPGILGTGSCWTGSLSQCKRASHRNKQQDSETETQTA